MNNNPEGIVVVPSLLNADHVGAIVWWRLSGNVDIDALEQAWWQHGLDKKQMPQPPSHEVAFTRACHEQKSPRRLVRPLETGGFAIVDEQARGQDISWDVSAKLLLDSVGRVSAQPWDAPVLDEVRKQYAFFQDTLIPQDVSGWLCKTMDALDAVGLRDTGGIYFIPATKLDQWRSIVSAMRKCSGHTLLSVPAMRTEEAVEAALDAIAQEVKATIATLSNKLEAHNATVGGKGHMGKRALEGRIRDAQAMEAKLTRYEALLGKRLPALHDDIEDVQAAMGVAVLNEGTLAAGAEAGE